MPSTHQQLVVVVVVVAVVALLSAGPFVHASVPILPSSSSSCPPDPDNPSLSSSSLSCGAASILPLGGGKVAVDRIGPIILNNDGTTRRIANWDALSDRERMNALDRIARRNRDRAEALSGSSTKQAGDGPDDNSNNGMV